MAVNVLLHARPTKSVVVLAAGCYTIIMVSSSDMIGSVLSDKQSKAFAICWNKLARASCVGWSIFV
jgi:hypothetical protein